MTEKAASKAWLVRKSGTLAGTRHLLRGPLTRVGRGPENDIVINESAIVSARHLEIRRQGSSYRIYDLDSTNGTYVNEERIAEAALEPPASIRFGADGPELEFVLEAVAAPELTRTLIAPPLPPSQDAGAPQEQDSPAAAISKQDEELLSKAVARARLARRKGVGDQTVVIMREMLGAALHRTSKKFKTVIGVLLFALLAVTGYGYWRIEALKREKRSIDTQIQEIEARLQKGPGNATEAGQLVDRLDQYQDQARALQSNLLFRVGVREREESTQQEIKTLMAEFGAETYSVPPEFLEQVNRFIERYQGPNRPHMAHALGQARKDMETMRQIFEENSLPPDLAYMVLVESALSADSTSQARAAGLWQFTPITARAYGLKVTKDVDERLDTHKATWAACKYIRELILDFGAGSSVMLALAAYNFGPARVKQAVRKEVSDPIKQRNFWYLYRVRALPAETREYVPKVIAAMIIARTPERFGF